MTISPERLYQKIKDLTKKIKQDLRRKGMIIPTRKNKSIIRVGNYLIKRKENEFYSVVSVDGEIMADQLNLPHTAAIIANQLALKQQFDVSIVNRDREYGYACFEDQMYTRAKERMDLDPYYNDIKVYKYQESGERAENLKKSIIAQFEKLNKVA